MKALKFFLFLIFSVSIFLLVYNLLGSIVKIYANDHIISPIPKGDVLSQTTFPRQPTPAEQDTKLGEIVAESLRGTKGTYGIFIKNLKSGKVFQQNENMEFASASLYKLWLMAETFRQLEEGELKEEQVLHDTIPSLNNKFHIATEAAELHDGDIELSIEEALEKAITVSDNYAALLLTSKVRLSNLAEFLRYEGMSMSHVGDTPETTPQDIASFYETLYKGTLINKEASNKMLVLLKKQRLNDRIPKYLPMDIEVAHKTGELEGYKHDTGIVYTPKGDYILIILSKSDDQKRAAERIALLSKAVYVYFTEQ